jgi:hypothetical protein
MLGVVLLLRAALSLVDAVAIATGGFAQLGGIAHTESTALWPVVWGLVALLAAVLLLLRRPLGWVLAVGVSVAYLVVGVAHAVDATSSGTGLPVGVWIIFVTDVLAPSLVLAGLFTVRPWFLATARTRAPGRAAR